MRKPKFKVFIDGGLALRERAKGIAAQTVLGLSASGVRSSKNHGETAIHKYRLLHVYDTAVMGFRRFALRNWTTRQSRRIIDFFRKLPSLMRRIASSVRRLPHVVVSSVRRSFSRAVSFPRKSWPTIISIVRRLLPIISFAIPMYILYTLDPASFEATWKGRTFYLFFIWLITLETILSWRKPKPILGSFKPLKIAALGIALALPTVYVIGANYLGLNDAIKSFAKQYNIVNDSAGIPLSAEYLVLAILSVTILALNYGVQGLPDFSIAPVFLGVIGFIYILDGFYPNGKFAPFQMIVPATTQLATGILNMMGYTTRIGYIANNPTYGSMTTLKVTDSTGGTASAAIAWPCSGIESLIIYTITISLFLRKSAISAWLKLTLFSIGAAVTYFINALRIATIFIIGVDTGGVASPAASQFHNYYGQLYSISWIILYPLLIIGLQLLAHRIKMPKPRQLPSVKPA